MEKLRVLLLGQFSVHLAQTSPALKAGPASLLAYLALFQGRPLGRARVAGALWPDLSEGRARANLSTVAWRLRRDLSAQGYPGRIIRASPESLELDSKICDVDVQDFRRESNALGMHALSIEGLARAARALELYRGDLLEDWDFVWCQLDREELRQHYYRMLRGLAEGFEQRGRYDLALQYVQKAVSVDPLNESTQRILMRILHCAGDRTAAVSHFRRFADLARSELGIEPDGETMALLSEIKRTDPILAPGSSMEAREFPPIRPDAAPLIGRSKERQQAADLMDAARTGTGGAMLILGDAGIGKSKFVNWSMEEWVTRGGHVVQGRCIEFNEPIPYQPILDGLGSYLNEKDLFGFAKRAGGTRQMPSLVDAAERNVVGERNLAWSWPAGKLRLFNWLTTILGDVTRQHPLLILIEDLQWVDAGTVDFLSHLLDRAKSMKLAVLLTSRFTAGGARHTINMERLGRYCAEVIHLGPLSEVETTKLVGCLVDPNGASPKLASWIYAETEGNPLFVIETLRLLQQRGDLRAPDRSLIENPKDPASFGLGHDIPEGVRSAIHQRLRLIAPAARRIAEIASILGRTFDEELLCVIAATSENRLSRAIRQLLHAGIFERENAGYRFTHDKIRAFCYESLSVAARRTYHARAAAVLALAPGVPPHHLAWHRHCAGQWYLAVPSWVQAGDKAREVHAYEEALQAYRHAISCMRRDGTRGTEAGAIEEISLLVKLDEVLAILGRPTDRREVLDHIGGICRRTLNPSLQVIWFIRQALLEEHIGNCHLAANLARRAWALARATRESAMEVEALKVLAWALNRAGRHTRSRLVSQILLRKMGDADSPTKASALWQVAAACIAQGEYANGSYYLRLAKDALNRSGYSSEYPLVLIGEAIVSRVMGKPQESRASLLRALRLARASTDRITIARASIHLVTLDALEGKLAHALWRLRRTSADSRSAGLTRTYVACLNEVAYSVGRLIGNYPWAWSATDRAMGMFEPLESRDMLTMLRSSQAQLLLDESRLEQAISVASEVLRQFNCGRSSGSSNRHYQEALTIRGAAFLQIGDLPCALADLEGARDAQFQTGERLLLVDTLSFLSHAYAENDDSGRALATSEEALRLLAEIGYANYQPQRIFWHHYLILEMFDRLPRLHYLERAVEFIEAQASSLSRAQARRLRQGVRLNREILGAWERYHQPLRQTADALSS